MSEQTTPEGAKPPETPDEPDVLEQPEPADVEKMSDAEEIAQRSPDILDDEAKDHEHVKVFVIAPGMKPTEDNGFDHEPNKAATRQYAISQGMRPIGDVRVVSIGKHTDKVSWRVKYAVRVAVDERLELPSSGDIVSNGPSEDEPDTSEEPTE